MKLENSRNELTFSVNNTIQLWGVVILIIVFANHNVLADKRFVISQNSSSYVNKTIWNTIPVGGDTIFISSDRTKAIKFKSIEGEENNPIVIVNTGGQVKIENPLGWGAIEFLDSKHIKIIGNGHPGFKYGFLLSAKTCGLAFSGLSSDCEAANVKISHTGFFGIMAKKDYGGNPPTPVPVFKNLIIHDCFIENVSEGMYLGETKSPGMEFRHVRVFNNIVRNTKRECIQIANMVEDVKIYNNTLLNGGADGLGHHGSILQVGDNSVSEVYNNIMIGASSYGIASYGKGNNYFYNNYIASCKGVFVDDRLFSLTDSFIVFSENYFKDITHAEDEIIRNMNGNNYLLVENNYYDDETALLYRNYYSSNTNFTLRANVVTAIPSIHFANISENNYSLTEDNQSEFSNLGAAGGPEYFDYEEEVKEEEQVVSSQIILNPEMVIDEVEGGSLNLPDLLTDEQNSTPENGTHPSSKEWKPAWNMSNGPYHCYIDLGAEYQLSAIVLHDTYNTHNLDISIGKPGNWEYLLTESCDAYKAWKTHKVDVTTRYLRLSMNESVYAAINELLLYGNMVSEENITKSGSIAGNTIIAQKEVKSLFTAEFKTEDIYILQNPVIDNLEIHIPADLNENFTIEVFDIRGAKLVSENFAQSSTSRFNMDLADKYLKDGAYIMRFSNAAGQHKALKFIKSNY